MARLARMLARHVLLPLAVLGDPVVAGQSGHPPPPRTGPVWEEMEVRGGRAFPGSGPGRTRRQANGDLPGPPGLPDQRWPVTQTPRCAGCGPWWPTASAPAARHREGLVMNVTIVSIFAHGCGSHHFPRCGTGTEKRPARPATPRTCSHEIARAGG